MSKIQAAHSRGLRAKWPRPTLALLLRTCCLLGSACGGNGALAAQGFPSAQGNWLGGDATESCSSTGLLLTLAVPCSLYRSPYFALSLTQMGSALTGTLQIATPVCSVCPVAVSGAIDTSGVVSLTGRGLVNPGFTLEISSWTGSEFGA